MAKIRQKAFGYLRVSGLGQVDGDGFTRQQEAIEKYAKAHRIEVVQVFRDEGVSGRAELEDREGLTALFEALDANGVQIVIVEKADRLARRLMVSEMILTQFLDRGVKVLDTSGNDLAAADEEDPERTMIRQMLAVMSQWEKTRLVLKLRSARQRIRKAKGRCEGDKPYGTHEGEATVIEQVRRLRDEGKTLRGIADALNAEGTPTRRGKTWSGQQIKNILDRE